MSVEEMKRDIIQKVETFTDEQLIQLAQYVEALKQTPGKEYNLLPHVEDIVRERGNVLKKLAQ